jgi:hypothetical protein
MFEKNLYFLLSSFFIAPQINRLFMSLTKHNTSFLSNAHEIFRMEYIFNN